MAILLSIKLQPFHLLEIVEIKKKEDGTLRCRERNGKKYDLKFSAKTAKTDPKNKIFKGSTKRALRMLFESAIAAMKGYARDLALEIGLVVTLRTVGAVIGGIAAFTVLSVVLSALLDGSLSLALLVNPMVWLVTAGITTGAVLAYLAIMTVVMSVASIGQNFFEEAKNHQI